MKAEASGEEAGEGGERRTNPALGENREGGDGVGEAVEGDEAVEGLAEARRGARCWVGLGSNGAGHLREGCAGDGRGFICASGERSMDWWRSPGKKGRSGRHQGKVRRSESLGTGNPK